MVRRLWFLDQKPVGAKRLIDRPDPVAGPSENLHVLRGIPGVQPQSAHHHASVAQGAGRTVLPLQWKSRLFAPAGRSSAKQVPLTEDEAEIVRDCDRVRGREIRFNLDRDRVEVLGAASVVIQAKGQCPPGGAP